MCFWDRTAIANGSIGSKNNEVDKGHPCRQPLGILDGLDVIPIVNISAYGSLYNSLTHLQKLSPQPKLFNISNK